MRRAAFSISPASELLRLNKLYGRPPEGVPRAYKGHRKEVAMPATMGRNAEEKHRTSSAVKDRVTEICSQWESGLS